ncbi:MAG: TetR/AcrR family transcriptional regulator [Pseudomonadota bacterium]
MDYAEFKKMILTLKADIYRQTVQENRDIILIAKEPTIIRNLEKIFDATLEISNEKGFQAMSMRDLAKGAGLSSGGLYAYFPGKTDLLRMLQRHGRKVVQEILFKLVNETPDHASKLRTALKTHLYLSEYMQPWFYFSYMEAKNLSKPERENAIEGELATEKLFADIVQDGQDAGLFEPRNPQMTAAVIKSILQDWYLKRWKFARRNVSVDQYADFIIEFVEVFLGVRETETMRLEH